ncbi:MAG: type II CAAX prenyl endopeptidase Rce1 family protein [Candidatus Heimdallarchaeota archaeon]
MKKAFDELKDHHFSFLAFLAFFISLLCLLTIPRNREFILSHPGLVVFYFGSLLLGFYTVYKKRSIFADFIRPKSWKLNKNRTVTIIAVIILGLYIFLSLMIEENKDKLATVVFAPLTEEFMCRVLLPYWVLQVSAKRLCFAQRVIRGVSVPLAIAHFLIANLVFASTHYYTPGFGLQYFIVIIFMASLCSVLFCTLFCDV